MLEYAADRKKLGAKTLFATHYHELTELEHELSGVRNYNIAVKKRQGDMNGFQLRGVITGFDPFVIVLVSEGKQEMIYKHAVSTIIPSIPVRPPQE